MPSYEEPLAPSPIVKKTSRTRMVSSAVRFYLCIRPLPLPQRWSDAVVVLHSSEILLPFFFTLVVSGSLSCMYARVTVPFQIASIDQKRLLMFSAIMDQCTLRVHSLPIFTVQREAVRVSPVSAVCRLGCILSYTYTGKLAGLAVLCAATLRPLLFDHL